jgi:hypothetical protein
MHAYHILAPYNFCHWLSKIYSGEEGKQYSLLRQYTHLSEGLLRVGKGPEKQKIFPRIVPGKSIVR